MSSCVAYGCKNRDDRSLRKAGVTFHRFPFSNPERLRRWIINVRRDKWRPSSNSKLCSTHFEKGCFDRTGQTVRLRANAVPTIFDFDLRLGKRKYTRKLLAAAQCCLDDKENHKEKEEPDQKDPSDDGSSTQPENPPVAMPVHEPTRVRTESKGSVVPFTSPCSKDHSYALDSPRNMKRKLDEMTEKLRQYQKKLKCEKQRSRRLTKRVQRLRDLVSELRSQNLLLSNDALGLMALDLLNDFQESEDPMVGEDCSSD